MPKKYNLSKVDKSKVFDEMYFKGKKKSYERGGYNFREQYAVAIPLAKTFYEMGVRKALDVGCATGSLVKAFIDIGIDAYGVDVSEWAFKNSPVADRLMWLDIDEDETLFQDETFDLVTMKFVIEHLHHPEKALKEIFRVLKPEGYIYIETDKPIGDRSRQVGHINVRSKKSWLNLLKGMNFEASRIPYLRFTMLHLYKQACSDYGPLAKKLLLHKMGLLGRLFRWIFRIVGYPFEESTHLLLLKVKYNKW